MRERRTRSKAKYVLCSILLILFVFAGVTFVKYAMHRKGDANYGEGEWSAEDSFRLEDYSAQNLYLSKDAATLKILQIADPQLKVGGWTRDRQTMDLLARALDAEQPDLAVCTGDLTLSIFTYDAYRYFADFMEQRKQYWTVVFGNHDSQFDCSKETLCKMLSEYRYCLFQPGPENLSGSGNFLINVYRGDETLPTYSLILMDSNMYPEDENNGLMVWRYGHFSSAQVEWYRWAVKGLQSQNAAIQSSLFFHIPLQEHAKLYYANELAIGNAIPPEIDPATLGVASNVSGVVREAPKTEEELIDAGYRVGIFYQGKNTGLFAAAEELGSTKGMFFGHDHVNTFRGSYNGIFMGYGRCCGYHTYPYFSKPFFLTEWLGLSHKVLWNGQLWQDSDGTVLEKGFSVISVGLDASDYGSITMTDHGDSFYRAA